MKRFFCVVLLPLVTMCAFGQPAHQNQLSTPTNAPEVMVKSLYRDVIVRHPVGIPHGANMRSFAPYLSKPLIQKIDSAQACSQDWMRQNQGKVLKAPFAWGEIGLFSGGDEKASPGNFQIERTKAEADGSFGVDVELMYKPSDGPGVWHITAIVVREGKHFALDDVIFLKNGNAGSQASSESRLSDLLSQGCKGGRWVGTGHVR